MAQNQNQKIPEENEPKRSGVRTMVSDIQEYAKNKKFSLSDLIALQKRRQKPTSETKLSFVKSKPYLSISIVVVALILVSSGVFWVINLLGKDSAETQKIIAPVPIIFAEKRHDIELVTDEKNTLIGEWKNIFTVQLLPREFMYVVVFSKEQNKFLSARDFFNITQVTLAPLFESAVQDRSTFGIVDTPRGNEPVFIIEAKNYSSAFAGLLEWEKMLPLIAEEVLKPGLSYERGENIFQDLVIANNDARFLKNTSNEFILGYSIFSRRFIIIAQSPQAMEVIIKQMSTLPPR